MSEFKKFDQGKLEWNLMPEPALEEVMKVLQYGKSKYGDWNWLDNSANVNWSRYLNALERHLKKFKNGQDLDAESRLYELAHIVCNALMLLQYQIQNTGIDDRKKFYIKDVKNETEYLNKLATEKLKE